MPTYVVFLRAINLGARRKVPMADLRGVLTEAGYDDVETHIQTGNVKLRSSTRRVAEVEAGLETLLAATFGFEIPSIVFTETELRAVHDDARAFAPGRGLTGEKRYVNLFKSGESPSGADAEAMAAWDEPGEACQVIGRAVHVWLDGSMMEAKLFNAFKKPLAPGTNRNLTVLDAVVEKWLPQKRK